MPETSLFDAVTAAYCVRVLGDPVVVDHVLLLFAQHDLVPERVRTHRIDGRFTVIVRQPDVSEQRAIAIADKMRALAMVESVSLEFELPALKRSSH